MKKVERDGSTFFQIEAGDTMIRVAAKEVVDLKYKTMDAAKALQKINDELKARTTLFWQKVDPELRQAGAGPDDHFEFDSETMEFKVCKNRHDLPGVEGLWEILRNGFGHGL